MDENDALSDNASTSQTTIKKSRRQTAFYPNVNSTNKPQKPFSRSAAKRESVMALGSIEHLQHYFTKTGIAAKKTALNKPHHGLVPALGGLTHIRTNPSLGQLQDFDLPPSPAIPVNSRPAFPQVVKTYQTDPESLLPGVVDDLTAVARAWALQNSSDSPHDPTLLGGTPSSSAFDVLYVLKTTTRAVRSIRNYVVSLPDESAGTLRAQFRSKSLAAPAKVPKGPRPAPSMDPLSLIRKSALEVLTVLRELEDSARVPLSDEAYDAQSDHGSGSGSGDPHSRVASPSTISDEPDSLHEMHEVDPDTSVAFSLVQVHGRFESVPVWEDEDAGFELNTEEQREKREHWDERLVLGSGWLYKQDVTLDKLEKEQAVISRYVDEVDTVLFGGVKDGIRGWERERARAAKKERAENASRISRGKGQGRRVSEGGEEGLRFLEPEERPRGARRVASVGILDGMQDMSLTEEPDEMDGVSEGDEDEEEGHIIEDEDLPKWARRSLFTNDPLARTHAVLFEFLPVQLLPSLLAPTSRTHFLAALSSGQLLCVAYNACVRKSRKPWGYVNKEAIHDIISLEQAAASDASLDDKDKTKRAWTFRRTDNLRLWAGALKLRYMLPIVSPSGKDDPLSSGRNTPLSSSSPSRSKFTSTDQPPIYFDAPLVARKDEGWEDMLEKTLGRWVDAVVDEQRGAP